jgi:hypothetical protein
MNSTLWDETAGSISIIKSGDATSFEQWLWLPDKSDLPSKWCFPIGVYRGKITEGWDSSQEWTQLTMIAEADVQLHSSCLEFARSIPCQFCCLAAIQL